jgi:hypothetical protein
VLKWIFGMTFGIIAIVLLNLWLFVDGSTKVNRISGISEIYFYTPYRCVVYSVDPKTKEYNVTTIRSISKARVFIDRGGDKGPDEVIWKSSFWGGEWDEEVHVSGLHLIRGDLTNE